MSHRVSVSKDYLTFSAAHFLAIPGHKCERLHGHNYVVTVTVEGEVDAATGFVVDFAVLKRVLRPTIDRLDHRVLVPTGGRHVRLRVEGARAAVEYGGAERFVFPTEHVAPVDVPATTAELLAEMLAGAVRSGLEVEGVRGVRAITLDVEESPGQRGSFRLELDPPPEVHPPTS